VSSWLDKPAGKHGFLSDDGDDFTFEDGTKVKFWGTNICEGLAACSAPTAVRWADKLARYGVNCVRFHKFTYPGTKGIGSAEGGSTELDAAELDRMDFFSKTLRDQGIYVGWSAIYGHLLKPADRERVLAYDEIDKAGGTTLGLVNFAPDLQDIHIELLTRMLEHKNAYSGLRYADDPSLAFVEIQNEDDIFFGFAKRTTEKCPTYRKLFCEQFSRWLKGRYGSQEALLAAWGAKAFNEGENLDAMTVYPIAHAWWYGEEGLRKKAFMRQRLLDTAEFLHETQNAYYERVAKAIRATGYRGVIIGSNWQAGSGISHWYNLQSDALVGPVDRHMYSGGGTGHRLVPGKVVTEANVSTPGGGLLAAGRQTVAGRPFILSECLSLAPNEWVAEGPPLIAAYGLGLQGWDGAFSFASNTAGWTDTLQTPFVYNVDSPTQLAQYPALAMMLYRGDVAEGGVISQRHVDLEGLRKGTPSVSEEVVQEGDRKSFSGSLPNDALAIGRATVDFPNTAQEQLLADLLPNWNRPRKLLTSTTGQLQWDYSERGFFAINTPGTQGVVGFGRDPVYGPIRLDDVTIDYKNPFCSVIVSSLDPNRPIRGAHSLLITAMARARNTGMQYNSDHTRLLNAGTAPILLEPVDAEIRILDCPRAEVWILDHAGYDTGRRIPVRIEKDAAAFTIGPPDKALYYRVLFP
jgi:hypothetical protein